MAISFEIIEHDEQRFLVPYRKEEHPDLVTCLDIVKTAYDCTDTPTQHLILLLLLPRDIISQGIWNQAVEYMAGHSKVRDELLTGVFRTPNDLVLEFDYILDGGAVSNAEHYIMFGRRLETGQFQAGGRYVVTGREVSKALHSDATWGVVALANGSQDFAAYIPDSGQRPRKLYWKDDVRSVKYTYYEAAVAEIPGLDEKLQTYKSIVILIPEEMATSRLAHPQRIYDSYEDAEKAYRAKYGKGPTPSARAELWLRVRDHTAKRSQR